MNQAVEASIRKKPKIEIKFINYQIVLALVLVGLVIFFGLLEDGIMFKPRVLFGLTANIVEIGLMALPMTFIILTGGIDLSVGSTMALSGIMLGWLYKATGNIVLAIIISLLTGLACGILNGIIITKTRIPALVTTLATYSLYYGIARIISGTKIFSQFPKGFALLANNRIFGFLPYQFLLFIFASILFLIAYKKTVIGVYLRGIGLNEKAIKFAGIDAKKIKLYIYSLSGLVSALAGIVYLMRLPAAKPDMGINLNIETITAVVLGGTNINGGKGSIVGTFTGILILGVLRKGMQLIGLGGDVYNFILGLVLVICLIGFSLTENNRKKITAK